MHTNPAAGAGPSVWPTVLVIDDDLFVCRAVACILREARAVVVHAVQDGDQALRLAQATPPDLILLDLKLPGMSPVQICREVRALPGLQRAPICVLTGIMPERAMLDELRPFVERVLTKPPDPTQLVALLDEYCCP